MSRELELIRAGDAAILALDFPPDEAHGAQENARTAVRIWRKLVNEILRAKAEATA